MLLRRKLLTLFVRFVVLITHCVLIRCCTRIINVGFYFIIFCVVLASWGIDPLAMFLSFSSVILAFTFAIGSASAKYFEVRRI